MKDPEIKYILLSRALVAPEIKYILVGALVAIEFNEVRETWSTHTWLDGKREQCSAKFHKICKRCGSVYLANSVGTAWFYLPNTKSNSYANMPIPCKEAIIHAVIK
jgi:hypothetical protein